MRVRSSEYSSAIWREEAEMSRLSGEPLQSLATSGERQYGSVTTRIWNSIWARFICWLETIIRLRNHRDFSNCQRGTGFEYPDSHQALRLSQNSESICLSSQHATGWKIWWSNLGGDVIFRISPDRSWSSRSHLGNLYRVIAVGKTAHPT